MTSVENIASIIHTKNSILLCAESCQQALVAVLQTCMYVNGWRILLIEFK